MRLSLVYLAVASICLTSSCSSQLKDHSSSLTADHKKTSDLNMLSSIVLKEDTALQFSVMVTSILEDSKGRFWFGSHGGGLCMFDGTSYTYFTAGNGLPMGIDREIAPGLDWDDVRVINGGNQAGGIQEDQEGNIWITSAGKICKFNGKQFLPVEPSNERDLPKGADWQEYTDYLWFGWPNGIGACVYNGKTLECIKFPVNDSRGWDRVSSMYQDSEGTMWFGTMEHGIHKYDGESFESVLPKLDTGISRSIFEDTSGRIWLPQNGKDMLYYEKGEIHNFSKEYLKKFPETKPDDLLTGAQCIVQDNNGDLWFGMFGGGVFRYDGFKTTHLMPNGDESLSLCKTIYKDSQGRLLFGLGEGSVYVLRGDSFVRFDGI